MGYAKKPSRAVFGDHANWSAGTQREVARYIRRYKTQAARAGVNPAAPTEEWLASMILEYRAAKGRKLTQRLVRAIRHFLLEVGWADLTNGPLVRRVLVASDDVDPIAIDMFDESAPLGRAQPFADSQYSEGTYRGYAQSASCWVERCKGRGIDPLHPRSGELEQYFDELAFAKQYATVRNARNGVGHYFRNNGVEDLTRAPRIVRILEGLKRAKPPAQIRPVTADERRSILATLPQEGTGARDRVGVLLTAFAHLGVENIALLRREHIRISDDGVVIDRGAAIPVIFVGTHEACDLDIVFWMRKLFDRIPSTGPLFRTLPRNMHEYGEDGLTPMGIHQIICRATRSAGVPARDIAQRLHLLFESEISIAGVSDVVRSKARGLQQLPNARTEAYRRRAVAMRSARRASPLGAIQ